ncbi:N-acyl-D-amino-acid deacylase family protein [Phenylobacterium sp.]|jgi:N-acyl-D-aspartate/D-glutamate deacylase|uniref:N-acyl-D-amino-acid deacylase family protein n=1 Tax=Phenylobacterium sp. TaxID=1871053 RepID=UPI002F3F1A5C
MLTIAIRNAIIIDGTGAPPRPGEVGISGDRIVSVGRIEGSAEREIDARGQVVAPGFIDIHTHYDPQLCWDRNATPTPEHGVTSLVMGNCSISLAPVRGGDRTRAIHLFGSVEDMEGRLLEATVPFSWETVPDYLAYLRAGLGPNVASLIGHSMIRLYVMGADSQARAGTDAEVAEMAEVLREALAAGARGLSFTFNHFDERGHPLPCHYADHGEKAALLRVVAAAGGVVEVAPNFFKRDMGLPTVDEWGALALETGATVSLSPILVMPNMPGAWRTILDRVVHWRDLGAKIFAQTQVRPLDMTIQLTHGSAILSKAPTWRDSFEAPLEERKVRYADPATRAALIAEGDRLKNAMSTLTVKRTRSEAAQPYEGRVLAEIAQAEGKSFVEAMLDIALLDDLETEFGLSGYLHDEAQSVAELLDHPAMQVGSGDAGAHITQFSGAGDTCYLIEKFVRERGDLTLERAVQRLTSDLASQWGLTDRGMLAPGKFADVVVFDPETIARGEEVWVEDVPGGQGRYVRKPTGVSKVIVNGQVLVEDGVYAPVQPGRLL